MAKASFHKGQRVFVKPVGTWALIEKVAPQWVKGVEEPLRVLYDVGLGREFQAHELTAEDREPERPNLIETEVWRILRRENHVRTRPEPLGEGLAGTFPVVCTEEKDWGGWRVPVAEYERDPERIEQQARVIVNALRLMRVAKELEEFATDHEEDTPLPLRQLAQQASLVLTAIHRAPAGAASIAAE